MRASAHSPTLWSPNLRPELTPRHAPSGSPDWRARLEFDYELDAGRALGRTGGKGPLGNTVYVGADIWRASDTAAGPATLRITRHQRTADVAAWGPGAKLAADGVADLLGASDDPGALVPRDPVVAGWVRRWPTRRLTRTRSIWEHVVPTICGQKVTGLNAKRSWQGILRRWGRTPPGPAHPMLRLVPSAATLAAVGYAEFHRFDIERRRAETIIDAAAQASKLEGATALAPEPARCLLTTVRGIGPWTAAIVVGLCHGDADSVIVGDYKIPNYVAWHLAGERTGDDERMLELLAPYAGQRARVQAMAKAAGSPPRHGPRMAAQDLQGR